MATSDAVESPGTTSCFASLFNCFSSNSHGAIQHTPQKGISYPIEAYYNPIPVTNFSPGVEKEMKIMYTQPHLVPPMKLTVYEDLPVSPLPVASSQLSQWMSSSKDFASRASQRASTSSRRKKTLDKTLISNPRPAEINPRPDPKLRPLELSIYVAANNRLSDLPQFDRMSFCSNGEMKRPIRQLVRAVSEENISTRTDCVTMPRKPASMFECRQPHEQVITPLSPVLERYAASTDNLQSFDNTLNTVERNRSPSITSATTIAAKESPATLKSVQSFRDATPSSATPVEDKPLSFSEHRRKRSELQQRPVTPPKPLTLFVSSVTPPPGLFPRGYRSELTTQQRIQSPTQHKRNITDSSTASSVDTVATTETDIMNIDLKKPNSQRSSLSVETTYTTTTSSSPGTAASQAKSSNPAKPSMSKGTMRTVSGSYTTKPRMVVSRHRFNSPSPACGADIDVAGPVVRESLGHRRVANVGIAF